jgi:hypothetical protein
MHCAAHWIVNEPKRVGVSTRSAWYHRRPAPYRSRDRQSRRVRPAERRRTELAPRIRVRTNDHRNPFRLAVGPRCARPMLTLAVAHASGSDGHFRHIASVPLTQDFPLPNSHVHRVFGHRSERFREKRRTLLRPRDSKKRYIMDGESVRCRADSQRRSHPPEEAPGAPS